MLTWPVSRSRHYSHTEMALPIGSHVLHIVFSPEHQAVVAPGVQCPFHALLSWASQREAQPEVSQGLCCQRRYSFLTVSSFPSLCLFPLQYCIHPAKQRGEREKYDLSLSNKFSFLWTKVRVRKNIGWEWYNQSSLRSVFRIYDLNHQTTPPSLSLPPCNFFLSKARRSGICTRGYRSHQWTTTWQFGCFSVSFRDARKHLRSGCTGWPETCPHALKSSFIITLSYLKMRE